MILGERPWTDVRDALASGRPVVAILPCGATEAHGPHLPLSTDVIISEGMAHRAAALLSDHNVMAFVLPSLAYAPAEYARSFAGTISIGAAAAKAVLFDIARGVADQGFACLAIANSHFDPANVSMLREFANEGRPPGLPIAFPDFTRRLLAQTLTEEFKSGACHAGQFETSLVMADRPDLVAESIQRQLPPNPSSLTEAISKGLKTFNEAGGPDAYFGDPAGATSGEGRSTFEILSRALADEILKAIT